MTGTNDLERHRRYWQAQIRRSVVRLVVAVAFFGIGLVWLPQALAEGGSTLFAAGGFLALGAVCSLAMLWVLHVERKALRNPPPPEVH